MAKPKITCDEDRQNKTRRYLLLDQLFRDPEGHTYAEIIAYLNDHDEHAGKRTIQDDVCCFRKKYKVEFATNLYRGREALIRYKDCNTTITSVLLGESVDTLYQLINTLSTNQGDARFDYVRFFLLAVKNGASPDTPPFISFEDNAQQKGRAFISVIADAILHKYPITLSYKPYDKDTIDKHVHPYHIRQFNGRWVLFAWSEDDEQLQNFPIDRIVDVQHLSKDYRPCDVDFEHYFDDIVGLTNYESNEIQTIKIRVDKKSVQYIRTKPLHHSQKELIEEQSGDSYFFRLRVKVNTELKMRLLSYSDAIEVLEPLFLRKNLAEKVRCMANFYQV